MTPEPTLQTTPNTTMRALVYTGPGRMELREIPQPRAADGECVIAVSVAAVCGSDLAAFLGRSRSRTPPMVLGHELVGRRLDGQRVVVNPFVCCGRCAACRSGAQNLCPNWRLLGMNDTAGCYAQFVGLSERQVYVIPEELAEERAILAEPLANIVHLFRIAAVLPAWRMGIVGGGLMGSLALQMALHTGLRAVLVEDLCAARLDSVRTMGATLAVDAGGEQGRGEARQFAGDGLDVVLDASGTEAARQEAFELCCPGGLVVLLGMAKARSEIDFGASIRKEQRVTTSFGYTPADFERSLELLKSGAIDLTPWTAEMPLEEGQKAFERMSAMPGATLKMLLRVG